MGRNSGFTFKQFHIDHDRCAMKVGTDGILLGAWAPVPGARRVLDIGAGSGLIALMLAQRTADHCMIDGVELDKNAVHRGFPGKAALIFRKKYSESLNPYAMRFITLILLFTPSSTLVCIG